MNVLLVTDTCIPVQIIYGGIKALRNVIILAPTVKIFLKQVRTKQRFSINLTKLFTATKSSTDATKSDTTQTDTTGTGTTNGNFFI